jgi:hypothetical protein
MQTISEEYREEQVRLHQNPDYGMASIGLAPFVAEIIRHMSPKTVTDYGAGKCHLLKKLKSLHVVDFSYQPYDPAFPEYGEARAADLVCCIDVLEHIEPNLLDNVLSDLAGLTRKIGFFSIHTGPAKKHLSDGRNAHLIQKPSSWWLPKLESFFEIGHVEQLEAIGKGFTVVVGPKASS